MKVIRDLDKSSSGEVSVKGKYLLGIGLRKNASRETRDRVERTVLKSFVTKRNRQWVSF